MLFWLKPGIEQDDPRLLCAIAAEQSLATEIEQAADWRFARDVSDRKISADFAGVGDFESLEQLRQFLDHPAHRAIAELWSDLATWTIADIDIRRASAADRRNVRGGSASQLPEPRIG